MLSIQLTGQCAAKGQWGSGSVINYKQISSYRDPLSHEHHFSWCLVNLINQQLSPCNHQPASLYFMARFIHFLHVSSVLQCQSLQKQRWMFDHGGVGCKKKQKKNIPSRVVSPSLHLLFHSFTAIFIFCLFLRSCMQNTTLPLTEEGAFWVSRTKATHFTTSRQHSYLMTFFFWFHKSNSQDCQVEGKK